MLSICEIYDAYLEDGELDELSALKKIWITIIEERTKEEDEDELFGTK